MEEKSYRVYMTDASMCLCNILGQNNPIAQRWADLISTEPTKQDNRTGEEIFEDISRKLGGETN